jgi:hypothetical protein
MVGERGVVGIACRGTIVLGSCELMLLEAIECHGMVGCCLYFLLCVLSSAFSDIQTLSSREEFNMALYLRLVRPDAVGSDGSITRWLGIVYISSALFIFCISDIQICWKERHFLSISIRDMPMMSSYELMLLGITKRNEMVGYSFNSFPAFYLLHF